ncbi:hypothetical protein ACFWZ4_07475 [Frateuria sp. GZRe12]|uniref:hypothetical protein n=1 Tax=Frateuria sp. GZRe12 TaxID=3351533 RepID=UPI003EDC1422
MATLIENERVVPAWRDAVGRLLSAPSAGLRNVVIEVAKPYEVTADDRTILRNVDEALRRHSNGFTVETVASTIFPNGLYRRLGRPGFYRPAIEQIRRGQSPGAWGTYALRLMSRTGRKGTFNPLEDAIKKITEMKRRGRMWQSVLEVGLHDAIEFPEGGSELPLYDPHVDRRKLRNMQCLSHLSFKITDRERLDLTAMYRHHYYAHRALGNLVGLAQLLGFVAKESGMQIGSLTCLSTHAELDGGLGSRSDVCRVIQAQSA